MPVTVTTPLDLITLSLKSINVLGQNEVAPADEANDALLVLNDMLDAWSIQRQFVYAVTRNVFTTQDPQQTYVLGPGGDFNAPRPPRIEDAYVQVSTTDPATELPIEIVDYDRWAEITVKTVTSAIPRTMWPDYQAAQINLNFWPVLTVNQNIVLYLWQLLQSFASLNDTLMFPPGYRATLRYGLAIELAPLYDRDPPKTVVALAEKYMSYTKANNKSGLLMGCDAALLAPKKSFNWLTGETS